MNHTQRIAHVARQRRYLTKALVREAVERYLERWQPKSPVASGSICRVSARFRSSRRRLTLYLRRLAREGSASSGALLNDCGQRFD